MEINLTVDRFEEDKAVLKTDKGETIVWPKDKLPAEASEGTVLVVKFLTDKDAEKDKRDQAKDILNEILDVKE